MNNPLEHQEGGDYYKRMEIQPVEFITKNNIPYIEGCIIKYVCRHREKNGSQDLKKAIHYLELLLAMRYPESRSETKHGVYWMCDFCGMIRPSELARLVTKEGKFCGAECHCQFVENRK